MVIRAFGAGATLLALVFVLFALARVFGGRAAGELSPRAQRSRARQSQEDYNRFIDRDQPVRVAGRHPGAKRFAFGMNVGSVTLTRTPPFS